MLFCRRREEEIKEFILEIREEDERIKLIREHKLIPLLDLGREEQLKRFWEMVGKGKGLCASEWGYSSSFLSLFCSLLSMEAKDFYRGIIVRKQLIQHILVLCRLIEHQFDRLKRHAGLYLHWRPGE